MARTERMAAYGLVIAAFLFVIGIVAAPLVPQLWPSIGAVASQKPTVAVVRPG
jgi:hypothetical protein